MKQQALIFLAIGVAILAALVVFIGPEKILSAVELANPWYLALALVIQIVLFGMWTERWAINIQVVSIKAKKLSLLPMTLVGMAVNNITPSARGGGEPVRAYILGKYTQCPMESSFATVIADRGLDTFPLFVLALVTITYAVLYLHLPDLMVYGLVIAMVILLILFLLGFYMSINKKMGEKVTGGLVNIVKRFSKGDHSQLESNALTALHGFQNSIRTLVKNKKVLFYALPLSFLLWIVEILRVYVVFLAFNTTISLEFIAVVFVVTTVIGMIPVLPGGVGAVDGMMILLFSIAGIPPSISAAATIVERLISFWFPSFLGIAILPYYGYGVLDQIPKFGGK